MPTKSAALRVMLSAVNDSGMEPDKAFDESLVLAMFNDFTPGRRIQLAAGAVDQVVAFTAALALLVFSHDNPFKLRVNDVETLLPNLRCFLIWADDKDEAAASAAVFLSGNGTTPSDVEVWVIEKPA